MRGLQTFIADIRESLSIFSLLCDVVHELSCRQVFGGRDKASEQGARQDSPEIRSVVRANNYGVSVSVIHHFQLTRRVSMASPSANMSQSSFSFSCWDMMSISDNLRPSICSHHSSSPRSKLFDSTYIFVHPQLTVSQGYLFTSVLLNETSELSRLILQAVKIDLASRNELEVSLALNCLSNIGGKEFAPAVIKDILRLLVAQFETTPSCSLVI